MIRIIKSLKARRVDDASSFTQLPLVPASATLRTSTEETEDGLQIKNSLTARLHSTLAHMKGLLYSDLILVARFDDGSETTIGTKDIPVHLRISESDTLDISTEHVSGIV